jgi:hypothetical protein
LGENNNDPLERIKTLRMAKEARKARKQPFGYSARPQQRYEKPEKKGSHAEHIR